MGSMSHTADWPWDGPSHVRGSEGRGEQIYPLSRKCEESSRRSAGDLQGCNFAQVPGEDQPRRWQGQR